LRFLELNGRTWGQRDTDIDAGMVERVGAGAGALEDMTAWIADRAQA